MKIWDFNALSIHSFLAFYWQFKIDKNRPALLHEYFHHKLQSDTLKIIWYHEGCDYNMSLMHTMSLLIHLIGPKVWIIL